MLLITHDLGVVARVADRGLFGTVIAGCLTLWGAMTMLGGAVQSGLQINLHPRGQGARHPDIELGGVRQEVVVATVPRQFNAVGKCLVEPVAREATAWSGSLPISPR